MTVEPLLPTAVELIVFPLRSRRLVSIMAVVLIDIVVPNALAVTAPLLF
jgi:hypothetical protein